MKLMVFSACGFPAVSVMLPVCIFSAYLVLGFSFLVGVMVKVLPLMDFLMATFVFLVTSSIR